MAVPYRLNARICHAGELPDQEVNRIERSRLHQQYEHLHAIYQRQFFLR